MTVKWLVECDWCGAEERLTNSVAGTRLPEGWRVVTADGTATPEHMCATCVGARLRLNQ